MSDARYNSRIQKAARQVEELLDELEDQLDDATVDELMDMLEYDLKPGKQPHLRYSKNLLDQELWVLGEMNDVAVELAGFMRERGVPEDDEELLKLETIRQQMAKNKAWVLGEKAREAQARQAALRAKRLQRHMPRPAPVPKPDVAEDPTTFH